MLRRTGIALAFVLGACGTADAGETDDSVVPTALPTVPGVGSLPDTIPTPMLDTSDDEEDAPAVSVVVTRPVDDDGVVAETVAERVNGNRLLVIGDSILASTATRYGGELCEALNPIGWSVEVDAEPGRPIQFGNTVAEARLDVGDDEDDFDAVVIHLGSNYGRDKDVYYEELSELLFRAAPRPTLLLTVTEFRPQWSEVNDTIDELAALYDNVTIIDWEKLARTPGVLSSDGLHPGAQGEAALVEQIAVALGELETDDGECLPSSFTDDSAVNGRGSSSSGSSSGSSSSGSRSGGSSGGSGGSSSGRSSGGSSSGGSSSVGSSGGSSGGPSGGASSGSTSGTSGSTTGTTTGGTTGGTATGGETTGGDAAGGDTTGGTETTGGTDTTGTTDTGGGDTTSGVDTTGGSGGTTTGDTATSGSTTGGSTGTTTGGSTTGGSTGTTSGGSTTGGSTGTTSGGSTTGGSAGTTTGGSTTGGSTGTTGGTTTGGTDTGGDGG